MGQGARLHVEIGRRDANAGLVVHISRSQFGRVFGSSFSLLIVSLSRQQPIYRLAKLPADCQKDRRARFLFSTLQS